METGFIKLHRSFLKWEWGDKPEMTHLFIHLLLTANYEDKNWRGIEIKRGQLLTSRRSLARKTGLSEQQIRTCFINLQNTHEITLKSTHHFTLISLTNYEKYQKINPQSNPQNTQKSTTTKEYKEVKNIYIDLKEFFEKEIRIPMNEYTGLLEEEKIKFLDYWKEKSPGGKKERWQMERVFDIKRRWKTWVSNVEKRLKPKEYKKDIDYSNRGDGGFSKI